MKQAVAFIILLNLLLGACKKEVQEEVVYFPKVKAIIQNKCVTCHTYGGEGLPVVFATDDDITSRAAVIKSTTIDPVSPQNKRMPQSGELTQAEKDNILKWFEKGGRSTD